MLEVTKIIEWDMGHRVPNHHSKCRNPHGHRYRLEVTVRGSVNSIKGTSSQGMVIDFADIKKALMGRIHDVLDHGYMVYEEDKVLLDFFEQNADEEFRMLIVPFVPTAENIAQWCYEQLADEFPEEMEIANCRIYETPNSWADFRPDPA